MLLSQKRLLQILGALWFIDGLLQFQPRMFTMDMINGVMMPAVQAQPAMIAASLKWIIHIVAVHLLFVNGGIAGVQVLMGASLLIGSRYWPTSPLIKGTLIFSVVWAFIVWYAGEGMNMLLTGQASILTGAPGAVLFYALLAPVVYPSHVATTGEKIASRGEMVGILSRLQLRGYFAAFWFLSALLQLQPYWWQSGQISQTIGALAGQGGMNSFFVDPVVLWLSHMTVNIEVVLNIGLIILFVGLGAGLLLLKNECLIALLLASLMISFILWWVAEGFGMIFTGMATDFNSGLLLIVIALACWSPKQSLNDAVFRPSIHRSKYLFQKTLISPAVDQTAKNIKMESSS